MVESTRLFGTFGRSTDGAEPSAAAADGQDAGELAATGWSGDTEGLVKTTILRRLGTLAASALLALQLFAGIGQAAVPTAYAATTALPAGYSDGNTVGFRGTLTFADTSTLSRLYLDLNVVGASAVSLVSVTKNGTPVANACPTVTAAQVDCTFKTIRPNDVVKIIIEATPAAFGTGAAVSTDYIWSTTGDPTTDPSNSHGDTWSAAATSTYNGSQDYAGGFDAASISNWQVLDAATNPQAARLANLPAGVPAEVDDGPANVFPCDSSLVDCASLFGNWIDVNVGEDATFDSPFQIQVKYYSGVPKLFVHVYEMLVFDEQLGAWVTVTVQETAGTCAKRDPQYPCFTWSNKTNTATIYATHNGGWKGG